MRFKSRDGEEKRIALLNGQIAIVGKEWKELPDSMAAEAYAAGCISEGDIRDFSETGDVNLLSEKTKVKEAIKEMMASSDPTMFTKAGLPDRRILNNKVGFVVSTEVFDGAWGELQAEAKT